MNEMKRTALLIVIGGWSFTTTALGFYHAGKSAADHWYATHLICVGFSRNYELSAYPQVRILSFIPRECLVPGDAFVLRSDGRLRVCVDGRSDHGNLPRGVGRWVSAIPWAVDEVLKLEANREQALDDFKQQYGNGFGPCALIYGPTDQECRINADNTVTVGQ